MDHSIPATVNCTNLSRDHFLGLATARGISAGVCLSLTLLILVTILFVRAFESVLQRLFVYLTAITIWYLSMEIMHIRPYTDLDQFCAASGFLDQWSGVSVLIFTFTVSFFVLYKVCQEDMSIVRLCDCQNSNMMKFLEAAFILFLIVLPLPFVWVPFLRGNYAGDGEPWCWIVTHNKDCSENVEGFWEQIGLWNAPLSILGFLIVLSVFTTAGIFCKRACNYQLTRRRHEKKAVETIILLIFLLLFGTLAGIEATSNLYFSFTKKQQGYALSMAHAVITPVSKLMIPVGYFFYLYSLKKFQWDSLKASASKWKQQFVCHCKKSKQQTDPTVGEIVTVRSSYAVIGRSDTHFTVPYTGGFTDIGSTTALIDERPDTGYGSCIPEKTKSEAS